MFRYAFLISIGAGLFSAIGCGNDGSGGNGNGGAGSNDGGIDIGNGQGGDGVGDGDGGIDGCAEWSGEGCTGLTFEGENVPLDIYVMFDLSCSMSCTVDQQGCCRNSEDAAPESEWRIQPVRDAMNAFLRDPQSAGIGVGLGFFGDHAVNAAIDEDSPYCTVEEHADAAVDISVLPASSDELISTLDAGEPQGGTPTDLAIDGACQYSNSWKAENPSHKVVILLVTDGIPEHSCAANINDTVAAAQNCYDDGAGREIYVLGVQANNNDSLDQLNGIAEAGGTEQAYLTDADDVEGSVLAALNAIRADATIPCTLNIPEPETGTLDYGQVNIGICDAAADTVHTYYVEDPADCDNGAWYYEDLDGERVVQLCDPTCETVGVSGASLTLSVGCETVVDPIR